jgi:osmotically-inducible protein OsmY
MSPLFEQGKDGLGKARQVAAERLRARIPGRRSGASAAAGRTTGRAHAAARRAETVTEKVISRARRGAKDGIERAQGAKRQRRKKRLAAATAATAAGAAGGAGAYFLSPEEGKRRRDVLRGRVMSLFSRGQEPNDEALADRVRSEIFRPAEAPKGSVNVNVENGVVYLRGDAEDDKQIRKLVEDAQSVDGVRGVKNLVTTS